MPTTLDHLERILRVADIATRTDSTLDELHGLDTEFGLNFFDPATRKRMAETNIGEQALEKLLSALPLSDLERIHALMYAGRDRESATYMKGYFSKRNESRKDMERSIAEKRPALRTYFDRALERAKEDGEDPNTF
jgi:hypothetical protein